MSGIRSAFLIAFASSNAVMAITFVNSMILARLLTPAEIGVFSVAYVITGLLRTLREMGLGSYIVQETELTELRLRSAFGVSLLVSSCGGLLVMALAEPAAQFYREPGLSPVLLLLGLNFFLVPFGATSMSLMRRQLRFKALALIDTSSTLLAAITAVVLASLGFSFMSLAWASLVGTLTSVLGVVLCRPANLPWAPALREWRRIWGFCSYLSVSSLLNFISYSAADLVLGRLMSMSAVAYFNRAFGTAGLFSQVMARAIQQVSLPYFAEQNRRGEDLRPAFVQATTLLGGVALPFFAVLAISADPVIRTLFGQQWLSAIPILQVLCLAAACDSLNYLSNQVFTAKGQVRTQMQIDSWGLLIKFGLVIPAALHSLAAVAWAFVLSSVLMTVLRQRALYTIIAVRWTDLARVLGGALLPTLGAALGPALLVVLVPASHAAVLELVALGCAATLGWLASLYLGRHPLRAELGKLLGKWRKRHGKQL